ncbi:MAG: helix-turn-helix domain-containing protein [Bacteroidia bacterium]|nr:helix-turn-helix domain-containing protein [Bacteroidia bacterium]
MQLDEAKEKFIQAWGALGSNWGINRTMAQVHALLLISPESLSADEIMETLNISRGNANMNLRALIDWGLVSKEHRAGERREYFFAEKDIWQVAQQVIIERRKRELKPVMKVLEEVKEISGDKDDQNVKAFIESVENLHNIVGQADKFLEIAIKADRGWFFGALLKMFQRQVKK